MPLIVQLGPWRGDWPSRRAVTPSGFECVKDAAPELGHR